MMVLVLLLLMIVVAAAVIGWIPPAAAEAARKKAEDDEAAKKREGAPSPTDGKVKRRDVIKLCLLLESDDWRTDEMSMGDDRRYRLSRMVPPREVSARTPPCLEMAGLHC